MAINLEFRLNRRILQVIYETCEGESEKVVNESANEEEAGELLLQKVYEKIEPFFQSEDFSQVYNKGKTKIQSHNSLENAKIKYKNSAMNEVEKVVSRVWKLRLEVEELKRKHKAFTDNVVPSKKITSKSIFKAKKNQVQ